MQLVIFAIENLLEQVKPTPAGSDADQPWQTNTDYLEAIARLNYCGLRVIIFHSLEKLSPSTLDQSHQMHAEIQQLLARMGGHIDGIFIGSTEAENNIPITGNSLFAEIKQRFRVSSEQIGVLSDKPHFLLQAQHAGTLVLYIDHSKGSDTENSIPRFHQLNDAIDFLIAHTP